jgi:hypothetical protein
MFGPIPPAPEPTPEEAAEQAADQKLDRAYALANQLLDQGKKPGEVIRILQDQGHETAGPLVHQLVRNRAFDLKYSADFREQLRQAGHKNMMIGGLVCAAGTVITLGTLAAASGAGGGSYVVAWGAIVFGGIQFFRGLGQIGQSRR